MIHIWADVKKTQQKKRKETREGGLHSHHLRLVITDCIVIQSEKPPLPTLPLKDTHAHTHTQRVFHFAITQAVDQLQPAVYSPHFLVWHSSCTSTHPACCPSCLSLLVLRCHSERFHHNRYRSQPDMRSHRFQKCYCHTEAGRLVQVKGDSAYSHKPNLLYLSP